MKRILLLPALVLAAGAGWYGYGAFLASTLPKVEIRAVSTLPIQKERSLPFYELMSPVPSLGANQLVPRLEYKKGPPDRFIERISILVQPKEGSSKERIIYHGRRTRSDFTGLKLFDGNQPEARYVEAALRLSQGQTDLSPLELFIYRPFLLQEAALHLKNVESVAIMDQAGSPAFFFTGKPAANGKVRSTALFIRRNSFYQVDYVGEKGFVALNPEILFRKSFLTERRADALEYLAKNLSEVHLEQSGLKDFKSVAWPILLLAANVSVDPSSLNGYFHFAGISALLYRSVSMDGSDTETLDVLRNNVLASEFYAKDVNADARQTAEIGRLARLLTRNFE